MILQGQFSDAKNKGIWHRETYADHPNEEWMLAEHARLHDIALILFLEVSIERRENQIVMHFESLGDSARFRLEAFEHSHLPGYFEHSVGFANPETIDAWCEHVRQRMEAAGYTNFTLSRDPDGNQIHFSSPSLVEYGVFIDLEENGLFNMQEDQHVAIPHDEHHEHQRVLDLYHRYRNRVAGMAGQEHDQGYDFDR